jgi:tetratricopeptide (TPR) repeat protein
MISRMLALACLAAGLAAAQDSPDALVEAGHYKRAAALLTPQVAARPGDAHLLYRLAQCKLVLGDIEGAIETARRAAALDPRSADCRSLVAQALGEKALRGSGLGALSSARAAKSEAEAALRIDPNHLRTLQFLVDYCFQAPRIAGGGKEQAARYAEQIFHLDAAAGWLARARLLPPRKEPAKAEEYYRNALQADPNSYEARVLLAQIHWLQKNYSAAEEDGRAAIRMHSERIDGYNTLARVQADSRRVPDLEATLAAAERAIPDDLSPYFFAARRLLVAGGDPDRAQAWLRKYLASEPEGDAPTKAMAHWQLGLALEKCGRKPEAIAELQAAVRLDSSLQGARQDLKRLR